MLATTTTRLTLKVHSEIFELLPGMRILTAFIHDIESIDADKVKANLENHWNGAKIALSSYGNAQSHPWVGAWRKAYTALGISTKKYTSSIENLGKRALKGGEVRSINPFVDLYNGWSLSNLIPFGAFDLDFLEKEEGQVKMELRKSKQGDTFQPLDSQSGPEANPEGEICYAINDKIVTRHINWRQSKLGLVQSDSKNTVVMTEILKEVPDEKVEAIKSQIENDCNELMKKGIIEFKIIDFQNLVATF